MKQILELSAEDKKTGQRNIKIVLHEIYESEDRYNLNGITWLNPYVEQRIATAIGQPFVAEFFDSEQDMPLGHGEQKIIGGELQFKNSTVVGLIQDAYVERVDVNGKSILAAVAEGVLYANRYPSFVSWIEQQREKGLPIESSVEIARIPGNTYVNYRDGYKETGRIPVDYEYIGHAILGITPADDSAVLLELNSQKKGDLLMKEQIEALQKTADERLLEINELKAQVEAAKEEVSAKEDELKEKDAKAAEKDKEKEEEMNALVLKVKELETKTTELNTVKEAVEAELNTFKEVEAAQKLEELKAEFNTKTAIYSEEEKVTAEAEINAFVEAPSVELMSAAINKLDSAVAQSILATRTNELNASTKTKSKGIEEVILPSGEISIEDLY
ncbi:hypothetical protein [Exiguobacterium sp. s133]|uniref:hypothetical protein n=1 Tax=Exiguobacterium sp. s133 TaxID=2751213 RepID=UPI001BED1F26|nr:hypothetical protein [Exiguobacterium sp. s133]